MKFLSYSLPLPIPMLLLLAGTVLALEKPLLAQAPVVIPAVQPAVPVVAYEPEYRGLFQRRLTYRPRIVGAVPTATTLPTAVLPASVVVNSPVLSTSPAVPPSGLSPTFVARPVVPAAAAEVRYAPVVAAPTTVYYPPAPVPTVPSIRTYRVPLVFGF